MTYEVIKGRDSVWRWEITDETGSTYLRSDRCFAEIDLATQDLQASSHLISFHLNCR